MAFNTTYINSNPIEGTAYSCDSDAMNLSLLKLELDYAPKSLTASQLKERQDKYDMAKKAVDESPCKDLERNKCLSLQSQIASKRSSIIYFQNVQDTSKANQMTSELSALVKQFEDNKCGDKINEFRSEAIGSIVDVYGEIDKTRIEEESKYQAKQKIFFGGLVLIGAVVIITMFGKNK